MDVATIVRRPPAAHDRARLVSLDVLRGVAILLVLFTHTTLQPDEAGALRPVLKYLRYLGPSGVDLFFVLSGFLVGGLLLREVQETGRLDVRRFLIRRGFKIWPPYFAFLTFVGLWAVAAEGDSVLYSAWRLTPNVLHLQNYLGSPREHTWSLAVEEHFYLVLPFLLLWMLGRSGGGVRALRALPAVAFALCVVCGLLRLHAYAVPQPFNPHFATHLRLDALFFGVGLAYLSRFVPRAAALAASHRGALVLFGLALLAPYPALVRWDQGNLLVGTVGFAMLYVGYGCILFAAVHASANYGLLGRAVASMPARALTGALAFVGYFSYPIYLWHIDATRPAAALLRRGLFAGLAPEARWALAFLLYVIVALVVGVAFAAVIDRPALALRERLFPAPAGLGRPRPGDPGSGGRPGVRRPDYSPVITDARVAGAGAPRAGDRGSS